MRTTRVTVVTAALVACVVFLQSGILTLYGYGFDLLSVTGLDGAPSNFQNSQEILPLLPGILFSDLTTAAAFGAGVLVSLRFIRSIGADLVWKRLVLWSVIATAVGAVAILVVRLLETLLTAVQVGPFPFGYSFTPSLGAGSVQVGVANALGELINPFVDYVPLVVLACVFLKLWLAAHPATAPAKDRASVSA
jgi:hypothetical protein